MSKTRLSDMEQLIFDYNKDNTRIWKQAIAWLTPKEQVMGKLPKKSEMTEAEGEKDKMQNAQKVFRAVSKYAQSPKKAKKAKAKGKKSLPKPDSKDKFGKDEDMD